MALAANEDAAQIQGIGPVACAALAWRSGGHLRLTVVVKATFAIVPGADMTIAEPIEVLRAEIPHRNNPAMSARYTRDTAPYLPRADVVLVGSACAPEGTQVQAMTVGLSLFRDRPLLEKRIHVYGDRRGQELVPFDQMPLCYEHAFGGIGHPDNPYGTGNKELSKPPNLIDPVDPKRPTCFAPLSTSWPSRKRLLKKAQQEGLRQPVPDVATDLDWGYFQAAPPDQWVDHLAGDEWLVLDGMHPRFSHIQSRLPGARALAHVFGLSDAGQGQPLALVADTLAIDADELTCAVVWRTSFAVPSEEALAVIRVVAGVQTANAPIDWEAALAAAAPPPEPEVAPVMPVAAAEGPRFEPVSSTLDLDDGDGDGSPTKKRKLPAQGMPQVPAHEEVTIARRTPLSADDLQGTMELGSVEAFALPFQSGRASEQFRAPLPPPRPPPPPASRPKAPAPLPKEDWEGTVAIGDAPASSSAVLPFSARGAAPTAPPSAPVSSSPPRAATRPAALDWGQTADVPLGDERAGAPRKALPFVHGVANLPPPAPASEPRFSGTVAIGDEAPANTTLPFRRAPREVPPAPPPPAPVAAPPAADVAIAFRPVEPPPLIGGLQPMAPAPVVEPLPLSPALQAAPDPGPAASPPIALGAASVEPPKIAEPSGAAGPKPRPGRRPAAQATAQPAPRPAAPRPAARPPPRAPEPPPRPPPPKPNVNAGLYRRFDAEDDE